MWAAFDEAAPNRFTHYRFWILLSSTFLAGMAVALYRGVISNFALQELDLGATRYGLLDGIREIPGLLTVLMAAVTIRLREEYALAVWGLLLGLGVWLHQWAGDYGELVFATLLFSTGLHLWYISRDVLLIGMAAPHERALRLGQVASVWAAASMLGMGLVSLLGSRLQMQWFFFVAGLFGVGAGLLSLLLRRSTRSAPSRESFVWRREYLPLYILTPLVAAREMITLTLATYLLVEVHQLSVARMALLFTLQGLLSIVLKPLAGKLTDRFGDRLALVVNLTLVAGLFLGYAFISNPLVLAGFYLVDNVLVGFADIALSAYTARLVPQRELGSTLSLCSTLAHAVAVPLPVVGGLLWQFGSTLPFALGVAVTLAALIYAARLKTLTAA